MFISNNIPRQGDLFEKVALIVTIIFAVIGRMSSYTYMSLSLTGTYNHLGIFWNPVALLLSFMNVACVSLIVFNVYNNYRYRNCFRRSSIKNFGILFFICIPSLVIVLVGLFHSIIRDSIIFQCKKLGNLSLAITTSIFFIAVLIFLIETSGLEDYGEFWIINFTNTTSILMIMTNLIMIIAFNLETQQIRIYLQYFKREIPSHCITQIPFILEKIHLPIINFVSQIFFCTCCIVFLWKPLMRHLRFLHQFKITLRQEIQEESLVADLPKDILGIGLVLLSMIAMNITLFFLSRSPNQLFDLILQALTGVIYISLIIATMNVFKASHQWCYTATPRTFEEIITWIGLFGQLCYTVSMIAVHASNLVNENTWFKVIYILTHLLQMVQNIGQSVVEAIVLTKDWRRLPLKTSTRIIAVLLFIGVINYNLGIIDIVQSPTVIKRLKQNSYFIQLFVIIFGKLGKTFAILQRLHSGTVFLCVIYFRLKRC